MASRDARDRISPDETSRIVDLFGGSAKVARLCYLKRPNIVSNWKRLGMPVSWFLYLRLLYCVKHEGVLPAYLWEHLP